MSGVVYGLLGYIWMQGRFNPASKLSLQPQTVTFMIVWFFSACRAWSVRIANTAHARRPRRRSRPGVSSTPA